MAVHLERAVDSVKQRLLMQSGRVVEALWEAVKSLEERDVGLARGVVDGDEDIDQHEIDIEEDCLRVLALYQPVATDLRFIVAILKINHILERIGDIAVNIAEKSIFLCQQEEVGIAFDFPLMAKRTLAMLNQSLDALVNLDSLLARRVCLQDDAVDSMNREMYVLTKRLLLQGPRDTEHVEAIINYLGISRHFERIADLATSIAKDVIYLVEGDIVRHKTKDFRHVLNGRAGLPEPGREPGQV